MISVLELRLNPQSLWTDEPLVHTPEDPEEEISLFEAILYSEEEAQIEAELEDDGSDEAFQYG